MKNKILFTVTSLDIIKKLKNEGIINFVYPLSFFCVGIPNTFEINQITEENAYLYINRVLNCEDMDKLDVILHNLPNNIKGIIFDDIGLIEILKDTNLHKILFYSHFNTNYQSINYFFDYVDDIIVSTDITEKEIDEIINNSKKDISLYVFGLISSMYSRRTLLTNHALHNSIGIENPKKLNIKDKDFLAYENNLGTVIYHYPYYNGTRLLKKEAKYYFYFPIFLDDEKIINILNNKFTGVETDEGFLDTKTIYKIKREEK